MADKLVSLQDAVASIRDGDQIAFGGGGLNRKPLTAAKEVARSHAADLRLVAFLGGPEVDLLIGLGKASSVHFAYVGLDTFGMAPNFRKAREQGLIEAIEATEFIVLTGLEAAVKKVTFLPTKSALGSDILALANTPFKVFSCPLTGTELVAVPALQPDVAFIHVNEADASGNGFIHGDEFGDLLLARAAKRTYLTAERVVERPATRGHFISRLWVDGVCETPGGSGFTAMFPDRRLDGQGAAEYAAKAKDEAWLRSFVSEEAA
ncbi:MAG TPA: CoA-transferase [Actinomycetota bacterium]|nr:CoA-transferase [Actinomycetota bacterium]